MAKIILKEDDGSLMGVFENVVITDFRVHQEATDLPSTEGAWSVSKLTGRYTLDISLQGCGKLDTQFLRGTAE